MTIKIFSGVAIIISIAAITFSMKNIQEKHKIPMVAEIKFSDLPPIGLDTDGYPAVCSSTGFALNLIGSSTDIRVKNGKHMLCMTKLEASSYIDSISPKSPSKAQILDQYPIFFKVS